MTGAELLIAGSAISAYGAYASSQAQADALRNQADLRAKQAEQYYVNGEREARITVRRGERARGAQIAAIGQSGTALAGSNLLLLEETAANYKEEALAIREASRYRFDSGNTEAYYDRVAADESETAGYYNIAGGLATSIGNNPYFTDKKKKT